MPPEIKAKIELVTDGGKGGNASPGESGQKATSFEKFKANKKISSGNMGKAILGGIVGAFTKIFENDPESVPEVFSPETFAKDQEDAKNKKKFDRVGDTADKLNLGMMTTIDGQDVLVDQYGKIQGTVDEFDKVMGARKLLMETKTDPAINLYISKLESMKNAGTKFIDMIGSLKPPKARSRTGGNSYNRAFSDFDTNMFTPANANMTSISGFAVYAPPPVPGKTITQSSMNQSLNKANTHN